MRFLCLLAAGFLIPANTINANNLRSDAADERDLFEDPKIDGRELVSL
jgi:hypothetical protein